jgi:hypothetical protein
MAERRDFLDLLEAGLAKVPAVPPADTPPGAGDDALHDALPEGADEAAFQILVAAQADPRFAEWQRRIAADQNAIMEARARFNELLAIHESGEVAEDASGLRGAGHLRRSR